MEPVPKSASNASEIGWAFVPQYYNFVNKDPSRLHCFYTKQSTLTHGTEGEEIQPCFGQQAIHDKFMSLGFDDCKVFVNSVDSQPSAAGGIIVQVLGEMSNTGPWRRFSQTFFLAEQPNGYFVLNDIFRYLKEEVEEVADAEAQTVPTTNDIAVADAPVDHAHAAPVTVPDAVFANAADKAAPVVPNATAEPAASAVAPVAEPSVAPKINGFHDPPREDPVEVPGVAPAGGEKSVLGKGAEAIPAATPAAPAPSAANVPADGPASAAPALSVPAVEPKPDAPLPSLQEANAVSSGATSSSVADQPTASTSTPPAAPSAPVAKVDLPQPKTWASLAAAGKSKWTGGALSASQGVSSAPPPASTRPSALADRSNQPSSAATNSRDGAGGASSSDRPEGSSRPRRIPDPDRYPPIESITTGSCFIKGVNENVDGTVLRETLVRMFGPVKELDIVRSKACAFLEFERVDSAKQAIQMSMPFTFGGQGGIAVGPDDHIINIETKKQPGERGRLPDAGPKRGGYGSSGSGGPGGEGRARGGGERDRERYGTSGSGRGRPDGERSERGSGRGRGRGTGRGQTPK